MRILGLGLSGCEKCGLKDLSNRFLSRPMYNNCIKKMCLTVIKVANRFFLSAIKEGKAATAEEIKTEDADESTVSGDGT